MCIKVTGIGLALKINRGFGGITWNFGKFRGSSDVELHADVFDDGMEKEFLSVGKLNKYFNGNVDLPNGI